MPQPNAVVDVAVGKLKVREMALVLTGAANIKINGIYFQPHRYDWADQVQLLTEATKGGFVRVR